MIHYKWQASHLIAFPQLLLMNSIKHRYSSKIPYVFKSYNRLFLQLTHKIRKLFFWYALLTKVLMSLYDVFEIQTLNYMMCLKIQTLKSQAKTNVYYNIHPILQCFITCPMNKIHSLKPNINICSCKTNIKIKNKLILKHLLKITITCLECKRVKHGTRLVFITYLQF